MTGTVPTQDEAQIRQLMAEQVTAMRATDAEELLSRAALDLQPWDGGPDMECDTGWPKERKFR